MLKRGFIIALLAIFGIVSNSFGQEAFMADKIVTVVGNSAILYSDLVEMGMQIDEQRKKDNYTLDRDAKNQALEELMLQKLLSTQAQLDSLEIQSQDILVAVEERIDQLVRQYGSTTVVEQKMNKTIYEIKDDMRRQYEEMRYAQAMRQNIESTVAVTPGEVEYYYKNLDRDSLPIIPEQYIYAQITKFPPSTTEAKQRVKENLLGLRERIIKGTKFSLLARMYSVDPGSAVRGGEMEPTPKETFVKPFADALDKLKPGQVSEVVETEYGFHIIELISKKDNLYHCRHILMRPIFSDVELAETTIALDSVVLKIEADSITFEVAALKFSDDKYSKQNGGLASNYEILEAYNAFDATLTTTKFYKEDLMGPEYNALSKLEEGDISPAFQSQDFRGNVMGKVVKMIEVIPAHPASLKDDYLRVEDMALAAKKNDVFLEWLDDKISAMYIRVDPDVDMSLFENKSWIK